MADVRVKLKELNGLYKEWTNMFALSRAMKKFDPSCTEETLYKNLIKRQDAIEKRLTRYLRNIL